MRELAQSGESANSRIRKIIILGFAGKYRSIGCLSEPKQRNTLSNLPFSRRAHITVPARESERETQNDLGGIRREGRSKVKSIKMLGLAALAALMAMAFVGASSAMAESTSLCTTDESPCEAANRISHIHETSLTGAKATLLNGVSNVLCDVLVLGDTVSTLANPLVINASLTYTNCVDEKPNSCTVTEESGPAEIKVLKEGHETAKVTGEGLVKVVCTGISCKYNGENLIGTGKGPLLSTETNGNVTITEQTTKKVSGLLCPATAKLDITTTPLSATYISA